MPKRKNQNNQGEVNQDNELMQELERLVNENNALMKVLQKISPSESVSDKIAVVKQGMENTGRGIQESKDSTK